MNERSRQRGHRPSREPRPRAEWLVVGLFAVTCVSGVALLGVYILGGQTQVEGVLLAIALGALGIGVVVWAQDLMTGDVVIEARHSPASPAAAAELRSAIDDEAGFTRRTLLVGMLLAALGALGAAVAIPVLSLGPAPGRELFSTAWTAGKRLVGLDGQPVVSSSLPLDSIMTVFPEGAVGSADSPTLLIHVPPEVLHLDPSRMAWAPEGFVAFSKICTHAGCPVGLYRATERKLICPCHQSTFDVPAGAVPVFGPAARPLPQLPIALQPDGTFVATGDFEAPVGPGFWNLTS